MKKKFAAIILLLLMASFISCQKKAVKATSFDCLPDDIRLEYIVSFGEKNVTVQDKLIELKAFCDQGKLVDGNKREIRFFRIACFGNPPYNYDEIRQRERKKLAKLKETCTVIMMECDPMIM